MKKEDIEKFVKVISINPDSSNIVFINSYAMSREDMSRLASSLTKNKVNFGSLVMVKGNPHDAVKLVSAPKEEKK